MTQRFASLLLVVALATTAGCASWRNKDVTADPTSNAQRIYEQSVGAMKAGNYGAAILGFENLTAIYPFSEEARQALLNLIYVYWRNDEPDNAVSAADRFILENPTHPRVDYALYMKGLARFPRDAGPLERLFRTDLTERPTGQMLSAYNTFAQLLQQHPESAYEEDARQRMIFLRNRLAAHEVNVARFYVERHAHVAAINRARHVLESYQETPSAIEALRIIATAYDNLGLEDLAADTRRILAANEAARRR